jgi:hypothetical protein
MQLRRVFRPCAEASVGFTFGRAEQSTLLQRLLAASTARHSKFPIIDVPGYSRLGRSSLCHPASGPERI